MGPVLSIIKNSMQNAANFEVIAQKLKEERMEVVRPALMFDCFVISVIQIDYFSLRI